MLCVAGQVLQDLDFFEHEAREGSEVVIGHCSACVMLGVAGTVLPGATKLKHNPGFGDGCRQTAYKACMICLGPHKGKECVLHEAKDRGWARSRLDTCMRCGFSCSTCKGGCEGTTPPVWRICWAFLRLSDKELRSSICKLLEHRQDFPRSIVDRVVDTKKAMSEEDVRVYYEWISSPWSEAHSISCGAVLFTACYYKLCGAESSMPVQLKRVLSLQHKLAL